MKTGSLELKSPKKKGVREKRKRKKGKKKKTKKKKGKMSDEVAVTDIHILFALEFVCLL